MTLNPLQVLKEATKEYPAIRPIWGVLAIIAAVAIVASFNLGFIAVVG